MTVLGVVLDIALGLGFLLAAFLAGVLLDKACTHLFVLIYRPRRYVLEPLPQTERAS